MKDKSPEERFLASQNLGLCVKDQDGTVLYQNTSCKKLCGDRKSMICRDGCMTLAKGLQPSAKIESRQYKKRDIHGRLCDVTFVKDGDNFITLLLNLTHALGEDLKVFEPYDLTKRESEIVRLILSGKSNRQIGELLFISKSTLKTHMNNIYKKLPDPRLLLSRRSGFEVAE